MLTGRTSLTALIPAIFGAAFVVLALVARSDAARKHAMHAAVVLALLGLLATLGRLTPAIAAGNLTRPGARFAMSVLMAVYIALAVKSFKEARRAGGEIVSVRGFVDELYEPHELDELDELYELYELLRTRELQRRRFRRAPEIEMNGRAFLRGSSSIAPDDQALAAHDRPGLRLSQKIDFNLHAFADLIVLIDLQKHTGDAEVDPRPECQSTSVSERTRTGHVTS